MSTTDLSLLAADTSALEQAGDPANFVVLACERAKDWLNQAVEHGDISQIVELKSQAEAIRIYTAQKQLGKDAELAAAEIVRRAERGIGVAIRKGQEEGTIRGPREGGGWPGDLEGHDVTQKISPVPFFSNKIERRDVYLVTDNVTDEQFDQAIVEAKEEGNLSRSNIVRKVTKAPAKAPPSRQALVRRVTQIRELAGSGHNASQIAAQIGVQPEHVRRLASENGVPLADALIGKTRLIDPNRVMQESVSTLEGLVMGLSLIAEDLDRLDPERVKEWAISFGASVRSLNRFRKQLEEMTL